MPPESWCGYAFKRISAAGFCTFSRFAARYSLHRLRTRNVLMAHNRFAELVPPKGKGGVERRHRLSENHRQLVTTEIGIFPRGAFKIVATKLHIAADNLRAGGQ